MFTCWQTYKHSNIVSNKSQEKRAKKLATEVTENGEKIQLKRKKGSGFTRI